MKTPFLLIALGAVIAVLVTLNGYVFYLAFAVVAPVLVVGTTKLLRGFAFTLLDRASRTLAYTLKKRGRDTFKLRGPHRRSAFTLVEMLVVMAIIAILLVAVAPALTTIKTAGGITNAAYTIKDALEQARTYAMANNTYVWVGFYEEATTAAAPTNTAPPYSGTGRVVIGVVYSRDGTKIFDSSDPTAPLPPSSINSLGKLLKIEGIHLTDIGSPSGGSPDNLDGRSDWPYTYAAGISADHFNRISSTSADKTKFNFTTQNYTFYKTVRFDPRGEANLNSTYSLKNVAEIGIRPTHGNAIDANTRNVVAIQFAGIAGNFKIYRR